MWFEYHGKDRQMDKIKKANGMYWVGIPEAGLYILCGCPADSVKHLMKRGLIVQGEKDGIKYETGPNAILLSNHPNNTGIKPMLIGLEEQVKAQSQYIYPVVITVSHPLRKSWRPVPQKNWPERQCVSN